MDDYMQRRAPTRLEEALRGVQGRDYLKTLSAVRRSGSTPARDRNQIETAMATRVVKARVKLGEWQQGVQEIATARKSRDVGKLRDALQAWSFAEDEPLVVSARKDLDRWQHLEATLQPRLREAMIRKDVQRLAELLEEVGPSAPPSVVGLPEARNLLHRHETQSRALREALMSNRSERISMALQAWEFGPREDLAKQATARLSAREESLKQLQEAIAPSDGSAPDGKSLQEASAAWRFEEDEEEYLRAQNLSASYLHATKELTMLCAEVPLDVPALRGALAAWSFRRDNNPEVKEAQAKLVTFKSSLENALAAKEAWNLRTVWRDGGSSAAGLDGLAEEELGPRVMSMLESHSEKCEELWACFQQAVDLNAEFQPRISQLVAEWPFAEDDPVLDLGRSWLRLHEKASSQSTADIEAAVSSGLPHCAMASLQRTQGLSPSSPKLSAARSLCTARTRACQLAASAAHGVLPESVAPCEEHGAGLAAASRALKANLDRMSKKDFVEIGTFVMPPLGLREVCQVARILVAGTDDGIPLMTASERADDGQAHKILSLEKTAYMRAFEALPCLVAAGCRQSLLAAQEAFARYKNSSDLADVWNRDAMQRRSALALQLFDFILHVFELDKLILSEASRLPSSAGESGWPACPVSPPEAKALLEGLKEGMAGSSVLASFWMMYGGEADALQEIAARSRAHADATQARFQAADQALCESKGESGISNTAEPILQHIDDCILRTQALPAAALEDPSTAKVANASAAAAYLVWGPNVWPPSAAKLFGVDCRKDLHHPNLQEGLLHLLETARNSISDDVGGGEKEREIAFDEAKTSASVRLACLAGAKWVLKAAPASDPVAEVVRSFLEVQSRLLLEIAPARAARQAAAAAAAEAKRLARIAEEVAAAAAGIRPFTFSRPAELGPAAPGQPGAAEMEQALTLGLAAPHVQHAVALATERVQQLFSMLKGMPAASTGPGSWLRWMAAALSERHAPLTFFQAALGRLAAGLDSAALAGLGPLPGASLAKFRLLGAVALLLQPRAMDWDGVQLHLQDRHRFWQALVAWSPAESGVLENLTHAGVTLLDLWGWFESGCDDDLGLQRLYAWATLAVSLSSQLPHVQVLAPASKITDEAGLRLSTAQEAQEGLAVAQEQEELLVWSQVRQSLYQHCPKEPWWWLLRLGCESAEAFYKEHKIAPDKSIEDLPPPAAARAAPAVQQEAAASDSSSRRMGNQQEEDTFDDDFEGDFEEDKAPAQATKLETLVEGQPVAPVAQPAISKNYTEFEGEFEGDFEEDKATPEASKPGIVAGAQSAAPPQPYTEFEGDFEGDFEEDKAPPQGTKVETLVEAQPAAPLAQPAINKNYTEFEGDFEGDFEKDSTKGAPETGNTEAAVANSTPDAEDYDQDFEDGSRPATRQQQDTAAAPSSKDEQIPPSKSEATPPTGTKDEASVPPSPVFSDSKDDFNAAGPANGGDSGADAPLVCGDGDDDFEAASSSPPPKDGGGGGGEDGDGDAGDEFEAASPSPAPHLGDDDVGEFEADSPAPADKDEDDEFDALLDRCGALVDESDHERKDEEDGLTMRASDDTARDVPAGASAQPMDHIGSLAAAGGSASRSSGAPIVLGVSYEDDEDDFEDLSRANSRKVAVVAGAEDSLDVDVGGPVAEENGTTAPTALLLDWGGLSQAASPSPSSDDDSDETSHGNPAAEEEEAAPQQQHPAAGGGGAPRGGAPAAEPALHLEKEDSSKKGRHGDAYEGDEFEGDDFEGEDFETAGGGEDAGRPSDKVAILPSTFVAATAEGDDYDFED